MSNLITSSAKLVPYDRRPRAVANFATSFIYNPPPEQLSTGSLYVVIEVMAARKSAETIVELVVDTLGRSYYKDQQTETSQLPTEQSFELALKQVNRQLADYAQGTDASWIGKLSAAVGLIQNDTLHLSVAGSAEAWVFRNHQAHRISDPEKSSAGQTFGSLSSGQLRKDDRLLLTTPALLHQLPKGQLARLISDHSPAAAVQKLSELIEAGDNAARIAAVIVELTVAEELAMKLRPQLDEAKVGQPANLLQSAKRAAEPLAAIAKSGTKTGLSHGRSLSKEYVWPALVSSGDALRRQVKKIVTGPGAKKRVLVAGGIFAVTVGLVAFNRQHRAARAEWERQYQAVVGQAQAALAEPPPADVKSKLLAAQKRLAALTTNPTTKKLDQRMKEQHRPTTDALESSLSARLDQLDGLLRVKPTKVADFKDLKNFKPKYLEAVGANFIAIDDRPSFAVINPDNWQTKASKLTPPPDFGHLVATAASSAGDGVYLLTDTPGVWFFKPDDDSLTVQKVSFGSWPKGKSIASYSGNLYILAADSSQITKQSRTLAGFSAPANFIARDQTGNLASSDVIGVDGLVYTAGSDGLKRFLTGALQSGNTALPESLQHPSSLRSYDDGANLVLVDRVSHRIGRVKTVANALQFNQQYDLTGAKDVSDAFFRRGRDIIALADHQLLTFPLTP